MFIDHHVQQMVRQKTQNLELCFGTNVGTNQAKIEKISISRAIWLGFLRSLVSAMKFEANKSNLRREERPIGSRAVKMLRDLQWRWRCLAQHVAAAKARAKVNAQLVNMISRIVVHNRLRDGLLESASCSWETNLAKLNACKGQSFSQFSSVSHIH